MSLLDAWQVPGSGVSLVRHTFIETGTHRGASLAEAMKQDFRRLVSIDIDLMSQEVALLVAADDPRVTLVVGSSPEVLPAVMRKEEPTTFWLDAHYTGHGREQLDPVYGECPLLLELKLIQAVSWEEPPLIIIDDVHMFDRSSGWWERDPHAARFAKDQWPTLDDIRAAAPDLVPIADTYKLYLIPPRYL